MAEKLTQENVDKAFADVRNGKVWHWNGRTAANASEVEFILGAEGWKVPKAATADKAKEDADKAKAADKAKEDADKLVENAKTELSKAKTDDEKSAAQKKVDEAEAARKALDA